MAIDKEFLASCGITVLVDPDGQKVMGPDTFSFAPGWFGEAEILQQCKHLRPGLSIGWNTKALIDRDARTRDAEDRWMSKTKPDAKEVMRIRLAEQRQRRERLEQYDQEHIEVPFPHCRWQRDFSRPKQAIRFQQDTAGSDGEANCDDCRDGRRFTFRDWWGHHDDMQGNRWAAEIDTTGTFPREFQRVRNEVDDVVYREGLEALRKSQGS